MEIALQLPSIEHFEQKLLATYEQMIEDWSKCRQFLVEWEDENLLDKPTPEKLALHKVHIERLISSGQVLSLASSHPEFPRSDLVEAVQANLWVLRDRYRLFHGQRQTKEDSERILAEVFPDEP